MRNEFSINNVSCISPPFFRWIAFLISIHVTCDLALAWELNPFGHYYSPAQVMASCTEKVFARPPTLQEGVFRFLHRSQQG